MKNETSDIVILDCYTDEPSGFGVRPYLGTHQIHLSQALSFLGINHYYLTIDDLRFCSRGIQNDSENTDLTTYNLTENYKNAISILHKAKTIYIIMGCFVEYHYFSTIPPKSDEVYIFLKETSARKILFYVLGTESALDSSYSKSSLSKIIDHVEFGNTYRFVLEKSKERIVGLINPNYGLLDKISSVEPSIISQLRYPVIAEIETGTGCNTGSCTFCIESVRCLNPIYRAPESIAKQVKCLYDAGIRHFRLGRQPNFFHYQNQNTFLMEKLLSRIREDCPQLETLHIDNANASSVITKEGIEITKLIVRYCTPGNIAPLGIESFDPKIRKIIKKPVTNKQILRAIEIINQYGQLRGKDGFPHLLPGINLIYGLPGQKESTHETNLIYLEKILDNGWQSRRLFFRKMTRPSGISFGEGPQSNQEYDKWFQEIKKMYVMPMQSRVFPQDTVLKGFREVVVKNGDSYLRTLGTCSIRVMVEGKKLDAYGFYNIRITENLGYRLLKGEVVE